MGFLTGISLRTWLYVAAVVAIIAVVGWFSHSRYAAGEAAADARWTVKVEDEVRTAQDLLDTERAKVKKLSDDAAAASATLSTNYVTKEVNEQAIDRARVAALQSGAQRLRVAVDPSTCGCGPAANTSAATSGSNGPPTAELSPIVAGRLESSRDLADQIVREHTLLQDWAEIAVRTCNAP